MAQVQTRSSRQSSAEHRFDARTGSDPTAAPQQDSDLGRRYFYTASDPAADQGVTR
jgi:hypothetical protein